MSTGVTIEVAKKAMSQLSTDNETPETKDKPMAYDKPKPIVVIIDDVYQTIDLPIGSILQ